MTTQECTPPLSNRGVLSPTTVRFDGTPDHTNTQATVHIDWLQATFDYHLDPLKILPGNEAWEVVSQAKTGGAYQAANRLACGGTIHWNDDDQRMGKHLSLKGATMRRLRDEIPEQQLLMAIVLNAKKIARIDIAFDIPHQLDFDWFYDTVTTKPRTKRTPRPIGTRMQFQHQIRKPDGNTLYWGSPDSDFRVRVYDKAAELKLLHKALTRVEAQARDGIAMQASRNMVNSGIAEGGRAFMESKWLCRQDWYQDATQNISDVELLPKPKLVDKWGEWLMNSVLVSIKNRIDRGESLPAIRRFIHQVKLLESQLDTPKITQGDDS